MKIGLIFGGKSSEHEVSMVSAANISKELNREYYDVVNFGITKKGKWISYRDQYPQTISSDIEGEGAIQGDLIKELEQCDILFPVLHGPYGEDGTIQGFFEMLGKAYVGCDPLSSAICMDKAMTKQVCLNNGIHTSPFVAFTQDEWSLKRQAILKKIEDNLIFPVFVKAVHLGSSIGVYKVEKLEELPFFIKQVLQYDNKVLVEQQLIGRELEFAVLGNSRRVTFPPGEVLTGGKVYDYEAKYGDQFFQVAAVANGLSDEQIKGFSEIALKCYQVLSCQGMARIDYFLDSEGTLWLNEVNPIPGFTSKSLFPKICEANHLPFCRVLDKFVILGLHRHRQKRKLKV